MAALQRQFSHRLKLAARPLACARPFLPLNSSRLHTLAPQQVAFGFPPPPSRDPNPRPPKAAKMREDDLMDRFPPYELPPVSDLKLTYMAADVDKYFEKIGSSQDRVTAFDMEWNMARRDQPERRTGLIQVAHDSAGVLLFTVPRRQSQTLPSSMLEYIASPDIVKVGVNIGADFKKLQRDFPSLPEPQGVLELTGLARLVDPMDWLNSSGPVIALQALAAFYLEKFLDKGDVRQGNWEGFALAKNQLQYAAGDVLSSMAIYRKLEERASAKNIKLNYEAIATQVGSFRKREIEAWFRAVESSANSAVLLSELSTAMNIKESTVLGYLVKVITEQPDYLNKLSDAQSLRLWHILAAQRALKKLVPAKGHLQSRLLKGGTSV